MVRKERGITLIALVITIVVLLILAGITIGAITGDNGIINKTGQAKEDAEIANEKEIIDTSTVEAMGRNKRGNLVEDEFQSAIDKHTDGKAQVTDIGEEFEVYFTETNRYYMVDKDGNIGEAQEVVKDENPGDITVGKDGEQLDGSADHPYEIWCIEDLVAFSNMTNGNGIKLENGSPVEITKADSFSGKYVVLKRSLNFKSRLSYDNSERTDFGDIDGNNEDENVLIEEMSTDLGYLPVNAFYGNFNGEEHTISNIYINGRQYGGVFGSIYSANIKNLEVEGIIVATHHTGGIVGEIPYGSKEVRIENCINRANIEGGNIVGGIVGYAWGTENQIINCQNYGNVNIKSKSYAYAGLGGIVGTNGTITTISSCQNYGVIGNKDNSTFTGGIIGCINSSNTNINNCINCANVISSSSSGGIVGLHRVGENVKIYNNCNLKDLESSGGILGASNLPAFDLIGICYIENCYNIGKVKDGGIVGGMGGYAYKELNVYINNCYNAGEVTGTTKGGIIGNINETNINGEKAQYAYVHNAYYLEGVAENGVGKGTLTEGETTKVQEVKNQEFLEKLNSYTNESGNYPSEWKKWKLGEDGYPTFE